MFSFRNLGDIMKIYNTLTRQVEEFKPNNGNDVNMYTCGPTVYHYAHIGNLRTYIAEDILEKSYFTYGAGRIHTILKKKGIVASTDKIAQIMRKYKLKSNYIIKRPNRRTKTENSNSNYYKNKQF